MRTLQMYPKDITVVCEFSLTDIVKLRTVMDMVTVEFDKDKPEEVKVKDFFVNNFMEFLEFTIKEATGA
jgi:hypothetical protein